MDSICLSFILNLRAISSLASSGGLSFLSCLRVCCVSGSRSSVFFCSHSSSFARVFASANDSCSAFFGSFIRRANRVAMMNTLIGCVKSTSCMKDIVIDESHRADFSGPNSIPYKITNDADVQVAKNAMTYATYTNQCGKANFFGLFLFSSPASISTSSPSLCPNFTSYWLASGLAFRNMVTMIRFAGKTIMLLMIPMETCLMEKLNPIILMAFLGVSFSPTL